MIISLFSGVSLAVSDKVAESVDQAITRERPPRALKLPLANGEKITVVTSTINGIWSVDQWEAMQHEKAGDYRCHAGIWHTAREICAHPPGAPAHVPKPSEALAPEHKPTPISKEKLAAARKNLTELKQTGIVGTEGLSPSTVARIEDLRAKKAIAQETYGKRALPKTKSQRETEEV